jgi:hypothetical protein
MMKMQREISEYYSEDKTKKAVVILNGEDYNIDFYVNDKYYHSILYAGKSLRYVEDAAENYALGIFKNVRDF